jgi:hypothetical protein
VAYGFSPLLFQGSKTTARLMAKAIPHLQLLLCFLKSSVLALKVLLLELWDALQPLRKRLLRVNEDRPLAGAEDQVVGVDLCPLVCRCRVRNRPQNVSNSLLVRYRSGPA